METHEINSEAEMTERKNRPIFPGVLKDSSLYFRKIARNKSVNVMAQR